MDNCFPRSPLADRLFTQHRGHGVTELDIDNILRAANYDESQAQILVQQYHRPPAGDAAGNVCSQSAVSGEQSERPTSSRQCFPQPEFGVDSMDEEEIQHERPASQVSQDAAAAMETENCVGPDSSYYFAGAAQTVIDLSTTQHDTDDEIVQAGVAHDAAVPEAEGACISCCLVVFKFAYSLKVPSSPVQ